MFHELKLTRKLRKSAISTRRSSRNRRKSPICNSRRSPSNRRPRSRAQNCKKPRTILRLRWTGGARRFSNNVRNLKRFWVREKIGRARLNSSHGYISYAVFCLKKKRKNHDLSH